MRKIYGIDLDGVCFDFINAFRTHLNYKLHLEIEEREITSYYWHETTDVSKEDFDREFERFTSIGGYLNLKLLEGTKAALEAIHARGDKIYYITSRPIEAIDDTIIALVREDFPQRDNLVFALGKKAPHIRSLNIDVFIDDSPTTIVELSTQTRAQVYCRNYKFNSHLDDNGGKWFHRVDNWSQFLKAEGFNEVSV